MHMKKKIEVKALKEKFDRVLLNHEMGKNGKGGKTSAILVLNGMAFGGVSICHRKEQFNRALGRQIALGRALHAYHVVTGGKPERKRKDYSSFYGTLVEVPNSKPTIAEGKSV